MFSARFEGGDELARNLSQLSTRLSKAILRDALMDAAEPMAKLIGSKAPREPGAPDLADNITAAPVRARDGADASVGIGPDSKEFFYDYFQEYGTVRHQARPFYRPGFDEQVPNAIAIMRAEIWRQLVGRGFGFTSTTVQTPVSFGGQLGRGAASGSGL